MPSQAPVDSPRTCPYCNYPVPPGYQPLCLNCLRPLPSGDDDKEQVAQNAVTPSGSEAAPVADNASTEAASQPIPAAVPENRPPVRVCPACGFENTMERVRCERCAHELVAQSQVPPPPPTIGPAPAGSSSRPWVLVGAVLAVALLVFGVTYLLTNPDRTAASRGDGSSASPSSPSQTVVAAVPRSGISASASSTLQIPQQYSINNTLDGKRSTAWNSDGSEVGSQAKGVRLTYRFDRPRDLRRIDIYNGYQKSDQVFGWNGRLRQVKLTGDDGRSQILKLKDQQGRQTFALELGVTSVLTVRVEKVWRKGAVYDDLAVSEIVFYAVQ